MNIWFTMRYSQWPLAANLLNSLGRPLIGLSMVLTLSLPVLASRPTDNDGRTAGRRSAPFVLPSGGAMVCEGFFAGLPLYKASNSNAQLSSSQYTQPNGRGLREYEDFLLRENETFKGILPENGVIIDVGGGMGIAMRTLAEMTPIHAIVINTQDFSKMHERRTFQGSVDYRVGWAEDVLREIPDETADEVVDVYGGLTYSPHRIELIEQIYRTLKPGGTARLFFNPTKTPTWVKVPGEGKLNLHAYLEKELPGLVQLRRSRAPMSGGFVIEMRKPLSGKPKTINLPVELRSVRNIEWSIFTEVNYERKN